MQKLLWSQQCHHLQRITSHKFYFTDLLVKLIHTCSNKSKIFLAVSIASWYYPQNTNYDNNHLNLFQLLKLRKLKLFWSISAFLCKNNKILYLVEQEKKKLKVEHLKVSSCHLLNAWPHFFFIVIGKFCFCVFLPIKSTCLT